MKKTVGMMIKEVLLEKKIPMSDLGKGLCSKSDMSKYLNGSRRIDRLLLFVFFERMGKSPAKFTFLLTETEYRYFEWKMKVCLACGEKDWKRVEELLCEKEAMDCSCNETLQRQFLMIVKAILLEKMYHKKEECVELLKEAIIQTVPNFVSGITKNTLLGHQELGAILMWQHIQSDKKISEKILKELLICLEVYADDMQEYALIYPRVAVEYMKLLHQLGDDPMCLALSKKSLALIEATGYGHLVGEVLKIYIESAKRMKITTDIQKRKKQLLAYEKIIGNEDLLDSTEDAFLFLISQEVELLHEAISSSRKTINMSQEKLCESICEPETVSRIENGRQTPHDKVYVALASKLSLPTEYYFAAIEADNFEAFEIYWCVENRVMRQAWDEADKYLSCLRSMLDMNIVRNNQYIKNVEYSINVGRGNLPIEERINKLTDILKCSISGFEVLGWKESGFWERYIWKTEMSVLIKISDVYRALGETSEAIFILLGIMDYYKKSKVDYKLHYKTVALVVARLSSLYLSLSLCDEAIVYIEEGVDIAKRSGNLRLVGGLANNLAYAYEKKGKIEKSLRLYQHAFYFSDLMNTNVKQVANTSYERLKGTNGKWV